MSISTDITRIQNAKAAIKTAIEGKGVTVPDTTLLDGMAALIESIEAGGGGGIEYVTGTKVFDENTYTFITGKFNFDLSGLSSSPDLFIVYSEITTTTEHSSNKGLWVLVQRRNSDKSVSEFVFGYNDASSKYYTPYYYLRRATVATPYPLSSWGVYNTFSVSALAGITHRYYAFVGV